MKSLRMCLAAGLVLGALGVVPAEQPDGESSSVAKILTEIEASEYRFGWEGSTLSAPNRAHGFRTRLSESGIELVSREDGEEGFQVGLSLARLRRGSTEVPVESALLRSTDERVTLLRGAIEEWVENSPRGLEHGLRLSSVPDLEPASNGQPLVLELELARTATAAADPTGRAVMFSRGGVPVLRYADLIVRDARGQELPARMQVAVGVLSIVIDDRGAVYPIEVDPLATSPSQTIDGDTTSTDFGTVVGTAGDVNNDGYSDVVIGAPGYDAGQNDEGRAYVFLGSPSGLVTPAQFVLESNEANARLGSGIASGGDVNDDGFHDVIIGCPRCGNDDRGRVVIHAGTANGVGGEVWATDVGAGTSDFGLRVAFAGEVNGDNFADVIVGSPGNLSNNGRADVFYGSATWPALAPNWTISGATDQRCGSGVGTAGDVNGDGFQDVIVGCSSVVSGFFVGPGSASVYLGGSGALSTTVHRSWNGEHNGALFGVSVATAGDINADGYADVIVGSSTFSDSQSSRGKVYVYRGSSTGLPAAASQTFLGGSTEERFGESVSTAGDVNGDGFADVIVGAPQANQVSGNGFARVYLGAASGLSNSPKTLNGDQASSRFGESVGTAGDVNGDGFADVVVGAWRYALTQGRVQVYFGGAENPFEFRHYSGGQTDAHLGSALASGDFNADGFSDIAVGAPQFDNGQANEGIVRVFAGSATGPDPATPLLLEANQADASFGEALAVADVNGDGFDDLVVGASDFDNGQAGEGRIFIYHGSSTGLPAAATATREMNAAGEDFGATVAAAGDVDNDGVPDVIVGGPLFDIPAPGLGTGRVHLYRGSVGNGLEAAPHQSWSDVTTTASTFAKAVSAAGDINGDGFSDVLVGDPGYDAATKGGQAYLYLGTSNGIDTTARQTFKLNVPNARCGAALGSLGDFDGDGLSDFAVGCPDYEFDDAHGGVVMVFRGQVAAGFLPAYDIYQGEEVGAALGTSIASADINHDGYTDMILGAPLQGAAGQVSVWLGAPSGYRHGPQDFTLFASTPAVNPADFGRVVASAGDVNGDGFNDFIIGAPLDDHATLEPLGSGSTSLFLGGGRDGMERLARQRRADNTASIGLYGTSGTTNSFRLNALARCVGGRDDVRMDHEAVDLSIPLDGSNVVRGGYFDSGIVDSLGSAITFGRSVTGLTLGPNYHWRFRFACKSPLATYSPWITHPGNEVTEKDLRTSCTPTTWHEDADGDGHGNSTTTATFCTAPAGFVASADDCDDTNAARFPGNAEICDGVDNDCDLVVDDGFVAPAGRPLLNGGTEIVLNRQLGILFTWPAIAGADRYDVVRGNLGALVSTNGDFTAGTDTCVQNDGASTFFDATAPAAGQGFWYVVRPVSCNQEGTYNSPGPGQVGDRDTEIDASANACP